MNKSRIFVLLCLGFALGILTASKFLIPREYLYWSFGVLIVLFGTQFSARKNNLSLYVIGFLIFAALGVLRMQTSYKMSEYEHLFGQKTELEGYIVEDIDERPDKLFITFQPKGYSQRLLITTHKADEYFYGDWIKVTGKVLEPTNFGTFDYQGYLERYNVYALVRYPKILVYKNGQGNWLKENLLSLKSLMVKRINKVLKEPQSSLLLGILIGAKKSLPQEVTENFNTVGISHIVAVSGFNITILIAALGSLARFIGRKWSFWLSILAIFCFVIITGGSASVIRAAIMGFLLSLAFQIGRLYAITPSLCFTASVMLLINPKILYFDIGFQLSFLATAGIVYLVPVLERLTANWPELWKARSILLTTISAILFTLPLTLFYFERFSLVSPLVNLLIVPFIPATMLLGFLSLTPILGPGIALVANLLLIYILKIASAFARLPLVNLNLAIDAASFYLLVVGVGLLYALLALWSKRTTFSPAMKKPDLV